MLAALSGIFHLDPVPHLDLPEYTVKAIDIGKGGFGEVLLAIREGGGRGAVQVPARQMSDGMLRMLAIATALLTGGGGLAIGAASSDAEATARREPEAKR